MKAPSILVITPIEHISGVREILENVGSISYHPDPTQEQVMQLVQEHDAIFVNPNKSKVYLSDELMSLGPKLKVICTASTGTVHIDIDSAKRRGIKVISLTEEREVINQISSTAEHALALMLSALRRVAWSAESVSRGEWDYEPFIGRQLSALTVGVLGYGRLGTLFSRYVKAFGGTVLVHDPYKTIDDSDLEQVALERLRSESDVISLHVHVTPETREMINGEFLRAVKSNLLLVNTSRGEICDERALIAFLKNNPHAAYATDVLANESLGPKASALWSYSIESPRQVLITPHIAGMTKEGQEIAYGHAARLLANELA